MTKQENPLLKIFQRYSSWRQLKKVIAWILRYKANLLQLVYGRRKGAGLPPSSVQIKPLSIKELDNAEAAIIACVQGQCFQEDLKSLNHASKVEGKSAVIPRSSNIYKLDPMLIDGVIRVGGRLHKAPIDSNAKHPVILPRKHHMVDLIIRHYHSLSGHSGTEYTLSLLREKFWPINARAAVKQVISRCFNCKKRQASPTQQRMASLPLDRVTPSRPPFTYVGVDCFGPFQVKRGRSSAKRYGVLFTCLTVRAVHIEVANSLDTDSFLNTLRRFIARRGPPEEMRSDNGGNFVRGEKELREAIKDWNQSRIHDHLLQFNTKWTFNPPASSHHGGAWERCIRSVRKVLRALVKEQQLNDEGLRTLMCEAETIVNGRPITKLSDDPRDLEPLTPNHLLLLRAGPTTPPGNFHKNDNYSKRRWRQVQYLADVFWRCWTREYLPSLQQRQKWNKEHRNVAVDDVVLVLDESTPRSSWPLGCVIEVYKNSRDGLVRSVKVKTRTSELVRPVVKIVLLEAASKPANDK